MTIGVIANVLLRWCANYRTILLAPILPKVLAKETFKGNPLCFYFNTWRYTKEVVVNNCFPLCYNIKRRNGRIHGVRMEIGRNEGWLKTTSVFTREVDPESEILGCCCRPHSEDCFALVTRKKYDGYFGKIL